MKKKTKEKIKSEWLILLSYKQTSCDMLPRNKGSVSQSCFGTDAAAQLAVRLLQPPKGCRLNSAGVIGQDTQAQTDCMAAASHWCMCA